MMASLHDGLLVAFRWTVETSLLAAFLIAVVSCVRLLTRKALPARWVHAMWLIVVLRLALPVLPESPWSVYNLVMPEQTFETTASRDNVEYVPPIAQSQLSALPPAVDLAEDASPPVALSPVPITEERAVADRPIAAETVVDSEPPLARVLPYVWLAGVVLVVLVIAARSLLASKRLFNGQLMVDPEWNDALRRAQRETGVRRTVRLVETDRIQSPALYGLFRLRILIPTRLVGQLSSEQRRYVLLHELAHVKRHDIAMNWMVAGLQTLHWFNPFVWVAFALMRQDRETACDAHVLARLESNERFKYGKTLLGLMDSGTAPRLVGVVGILESESNLRRRLRAIVAYKRPTLRRNVVSTVALVVLAVTTLTNATSASFQAPPDPFEPVESAKSDWVSAEVANAEDHAYAFEYALTRDTGPKILPASFGLPERMRLESVLPKEYTTYARARVEANNTADGQPQLLEFAVGQTIDAVTFCGLLPRANDASPLALFLDSGSQGLVAPNLETALAEPISWSSDGGNSVTVLNEFARVSGLRIVLDELDGISIRPNGSEWSTWSPGIDQASELSFVETPARDVLDALIRRAHLDYHIAADMVFAAPSGAWLLDLNENQRVRFDDPFWKPIRLDSRSTTTVVPRNWLKAYPDNPLGPPNAIEANDGRWGDKTSGSDRPVHREVRIQNVRVEWDDLMIETEIARNRDNVWLFEGDVRVTYTKRGEMTFYHADRLRIDVGSDSVRSIYSMINDVVEDDVDLLAAQQVQSKLAHKAEREQLRQIREQWNPVSYEPRVTENVLGEPVDVSFGSSVRNEVVGRPSGDVLSMIYSGGVRVDWDGMHVEALQAARENEFWKFRGPVHLSLVDSDGTRRECTVDFLELDSNGESAVSVWNRLTVDRELEASTAQAEVQPSIDTVEADEKTVSSVAGVPEVPAKRIVDEEFGATIAEEREVTQAAQIEFALDAEVDVAPAEPIESAAALDADVAVEPEPVVRDLGVAPFGAFKDVPGPRCDTFILMHEDLGDVRVEMYRDGVVARFEKATIFADMAVRMGDRFRFEGNVRVPEVWGSSESVDVVEIGPALPEGLSLAAVAEAPEASLVRESRPPLAQRQHDIPAGRRKGSRLNRERPPIEFDLALEPAGEARSLQERLEFGIVGHISGDITPIAFLESVETSLRAPLYDVVDGELVPIRTSRRIQGLASTNVELHNVNFSEYLRVVLRPYNLTYAVFDDFVAIGTEVELQALRDIEDV